MQKGPSAEDIERLQQELGVRFNDIQLFVEALTHRTYLWEAEEGVVSNARLESLGDEILGFVIHDHLFREYPTASSMLLGLWKKELSTNYTLGTIARSLQLQEYL